MKKQFYRVSIFLLVGFVLLMVPALALAQDPTAEATEEAMMEATAEATEEAMMEATAEATEEAMMEATVEATEEAMEEAGEPMAEDAGGVVCESDVVVQADDWLSKIAPVGRFRAEYVRLSPSTSVAFTVKVRVLPSSTFCSMILSITGAGLNVIAPLSSAIELLPRRLTRPSDIPVIRLPYIWL